MEPGSRRLMRLVMTMHLSPIAHFEAISKAIRIFKTDTQLDPLNWSILYFLSTCNKPIGFNQLQAYIRRYIHTGREHKGCRAIYIYINSLIAKNLVEQTLSKQGWKRWSITIEGIKALQRLNNQAIKINLESVM